jgi:membrane protein DedA with SNARE-associated domain
VLVQQGHLGLGGTVAFGVLGAIVGNQIGYWVGHGAGREFVLRGRRYVKLTPGAPGVGGRALRAPRRQGRLRGPLFSALRVLEALVAGTGRMHWGTFVFYGALGRTIWATAVVLAGYWGLLGPGLGKYAALVPTVSPLLVLLLGVASSS